MDQRLTSKAAQSSAASSSLEELIKQLKEENASLKRQLREREKSLRAAIDAGQKYKRDLYYWKNRAQKAAASTATAQPKAAKTESVNKSTITKPVSKSVKSEPAFDSTKGNTYERIESTPTIKSDGKIATPAEQGKLSKNDYKNEIYVPNFIEHLEQHYGAQWNPQWSEDIRRAFETKSVGDVEATIELLDLEAPYYESDQAYDERLVVWPDDPKELYADLVGKDATEVNNGNNIQ